MLLFIALESELICLLRKLAYSVENDKKCYFLNKQLKCMRVKQTEIMNVNLVIVYSNINFSLQICIRLRFLVDVKNPLHWKKFRSEISSKFLKSNNKETAIKHYIKHKHNTQSTKVQTFSCQTLIF